MHDDVEPLVAGGGAALVGAGRGSPGASLTEVARRVDVAKSTAHHHVAPLVADGRVEGRRVGRTLRLYPGEAADGREESLRGMKGKGK